MAHQFSPAVLEAAQTEQHVELTTFGRKSGKPHRITISITPIESRIFIYSRVGMGRDWTQNLATNGRGVLHLAGRDVPFVARHLTDMAEARQVTIARTVKYGTTIEPEAENTVLPIETATFEALPEPVFDDETFAAASAAREVTLTTTGRVTGNPASVIIWITSLYGRLYVRSGGGMGRDWTRNLAANPNGMLTIGDSLMPFVARYVTDLAEAKEVTRACREKYGSYVTIAPDDVAQPAETATFEVMPAL